MNKFVTIGPWTLGHPNFALQIVYQNSHYKAKLQNTAHYLKTGPHMPPRGSIIIQNSTFSLSFFLGCLNIFLQMHHKYVHVYSSTCRHPVPYTCSCNNLTSQYIHNLNRIQIQRLHKLSHTDFPNWHLIVSKMINKKSIILLTLSCQLTPMFVTAICHAVRGRNQTVAISYHLLIQTWSR